MSQTRYPANRAQRRPDNDSGRNRAKPFFEVSLSGSRIMGPDCIYKALFGRTYAQICFVEIDHRRRNVPAYRRRRHQPTNGSAKRARAALHPDRVQADHGPTATADLLAGKALGLQQGSEPVHVCDGHGLGGRLRRGPPQHFHW